MTIKIDKIKINGSLIGRENPLPMFRDPQRIKPCAFDDTFTKEDKNLFGHETGFKVLPYKMQDSYSRDRQEIELKTIVLENENMRAIFLADYGGRLTSLFDKKRNKELLFNNEVFQPANLSTRDAWFSGGIEWNIGQFGHSVLTCEPLFFARMKDDHNQEFLRLYEFERSSRVFFSIDFHLPEGAEQLSAYVRIVNNKDESVPMYWWTNIAVREEKDIRVFSESDQVIYIKPESNISGGSIHKFGRASITDLPSLPGKDASKPLKFDFSSEYFFQNSKNCVSPWEAAVYDDGFTFFERSTSKLLYRKMFCWGNHRGGRNWCDYLSIPSKGDYLEIQAGLAPTQIHGLIMPGNSTWDFTQIFGAADLNREKADKDWISSRDYTRESIDKILSPDEVNSRHVEFRSYAEFEPIEILHYGSGWGALEARRGEISDLNQPIPKGFFFPGSTLGMKQKIWIDLLENGKMSDLEKNHKSPSWMIDPAWRPLLEKNAETEVKNPWPLIHLGILLYENNEKELAVDYWQRSLSIKATALAWRNMSIALKDWGDEDQSVDALKRAVALEGPNPDAYITRELMEMLIHKERYTEAWKYYSSLPSDLADQERVRTIAAIAAFHKDNDEFLEDLFSRSFAYIKEGETRLVDLWYDFQARKLARLRNSDVTKELKEEVRKTDSPPKTINFTMSERD